MFCCCVDDLGNSPYFPEYDYSTKAMVITQKVLEMFARVLYTLTKYCCE